MKDILPYLKPYRRRIALAMLLVAAATVCDLLLPTIMNDILNNGVRRCPAVGFCIYCALLRVDAGRCGGGSCRASGWAEDQL